MKTMTKALESKLRSLQRQYKAANGVLRSRIEMEMLSVTKGLDEHPEWWDMPCQCDMCLSYGD